MSKPRSPMVVLGVTMLLVILLVIAACLIWMDRANAADLGTRSDLQISLYNKMVYDSTNSRYPPSMIRGFLDEANQFVQTHCKCNIEIDTIRMKPDSVFYAVPSSSARNGVINIQKLVDGKLRSMVKRPISDFGKLDLLPEDGIYAISGDSIRISPASQLPHLMYVTYWKIQGTMDSDTSDVLVPLQYRRFIVDYAYALYMAARGDYAQKQVIEQAILNEIYMIGAEPKQEIDNYGIDTTQ